MKKIDEGFPGKLDSTYFTATDCQPWIEDGAVHHYDGGGKRRSWGAPQVTTTVVVDDCDFLALHVGFSHKHRGGQFWRYFVRTEGGEIERRTWQKLTDDERQIVLNSEGSAPRWAKSPGKLRADYKRPEVAKFTAYKILRVTGDGKFESLYDRTPWELGKRNGEAVDPNAGTDDWTGEAYHGGGFYVHEDAERLVSLWEGQKLVPDRCYKPGAYALVECECSGRVATFSSGKKAVTWCKPIAVVQEFEL